MLSLLSWGQTSIRRKFWTDFLLFTLLIPQWHLRKPPGVPTISCIWGFRVCDFHCCDQGMRPGPLCPGPPEMLSDKTEPLPRASPGLCARWGAGRASPPRSVDAFFFITSFSSSSFLYPEFRPLLDLPHRPTPSSDLDERNTCHSR